MAATHAIGALYFASASSGPSLWSLSITDDSLYSRTLFSVSLCELTAVLNSHFCFHVCSGAGIRWSIRSVRMAGSLRDAQIRHVVRHRITDIGFYCTCSIPHFTYRVRYGAPQFLIFGLFEFRSFTSSESFSFFLRTTIELRSLITLHTCIFLDN